MTVMKLDYRLTGQVTEALAGHTERIYRDPGSAFLAVVEFRHTERHEFADDEKDSFVKARCVGIEVANPGEQERQLREVQRALYLQRTASGKLAEADELTLAKQTLKSAQGLMSGAEVARLTAYLRAIRDQVHDLREDTSLDEKGLREELEHIEDRMAKALAGAQLELDGAG